MPPRRAAALALLAGLALAGCSRLSFVKPKLERGAYTRVAPEYTVRQDPRDRQRIAAMDRVALAEQYLRAGRLDEAQEQARSALDADHDSVNAHTLLAMIAEQRGQAAQAGEHYARAMALAPAAGAALNNYGAWLCRNGRPAESLPLFDRAMADRAYATPVAALANAGACALDAGQGARAERELRRAIELEPANPVALAALARLSYQSGRYMDARAFSQRRLAAAQASPDVLLLASQIEQKLGDTRAAARYVQRIRTEFPQARAAASGDASRR